MTDRRSDVDFSGFYGGPAALPPNLPVMKSRADMPEPPPPTFWEGVTAAARVGYDEQDVPQTVRIGEGYKQLESELTALGVPSSRLRSYRARNPVEAGGYDIGFGGQGEEEQDFDKIWSEAQAARARDPSLFKSLPKTRAEYEKQLLSRFGARQRDQETVERAGIAPRFIGAMGASLADPNVLGTLPIGGFGRSVATRIATEGLAQMGVATVLEPTLIENRQNLGEKTTAGQAVMDVLVAGAAGSAFQGGVVEPVSALLKRFGTSAPTESLTDAELGALDILRREGEAELLSPFEPGVGTEVHTERLNTAMEQVAAGLPGGAAYGAPSRITLPPNAVKPDGTRFRGDTALGSGVIAGSVNVSSGTARAQLKTKIARAENASGNPNARPIDPKTGRALSSALGKYQFIEKTWKYYYLQRFGRNGLTDAQILSKRTDGAIQDVLVDDLIADNARALQRAGVRETAGNLYLMHFAGARDGVAILRAPLDKPIERILSPQVIAANKFLRGKTAGEVVEWAGRKMGEPVSTAPSIRRDVFPEGDEGDAAWQAAQRQSDQAELEYQQVAARESEPPMLDGGPAARAMGAPDQDIPATGLIDGMDEQANASRLSALERNQEDGEGISADLDLAPLDRDADEAVDLSAPTGSVTEFQTSQGSVYQLDAEGRTTRTRSARVGKPSETFGKTDRTHYVVPEDLDRFDEVFDAIEEANPGADIVIFVKEDGLALSLDGVSEVPNSQVAFRSDPAVGLIPVEVWADGTSVHYGNPITSLSRPTRRNLGDGWTAALREGQALARQGAAPIVNDATTTGAQNGTAQVISAAFSDPTGAASRAMADGLSHDLNQALETGDLGNVDFAPDGVELGRGDVAPVYSSARKVLDELDAEDAAIAAIEACL